MRAPPPLAFLLLAGLALLLGAGRAAAAERASFASVDLELVLAADASGSVDPDEWQLQLSGIAAAFRDPVVVEAIQSGARQSIAVQLMVWADAGYRKDTSDWTVVNDAVSAEAFAQIVERFPRHVEGGTGIGSAVAKAVHGMEDNAIASLRKVVDVSGDGIETAIRSEYSVTLPMARRTAAAFGVTVNGLAIVNEVEGLADYYRSTVIVGPGSFVIRASDYVDFSRAMREKLLREIAPNVARTPSGPKRFARWGSSRAGSLP